MKGFSKMTLVTFCAVALFVGVGVAYAATTWTGTIQWNYQAVSKDITVSGNTTINYGTVVGPTTKTETYTVTNVGNTACNVTANVLPSGSVTATFDKTFAVVQPQETATFTLTLAITGTGSCTVTFTAT